MPFTAPTFAQSFGPGTAAGDANTAAGGPQNADAALMASINRPDWIVIAKSPLGSDGVSTWQIVGPNSQPDTIDVAANGTIVTGPKNTPTKPTAADKTPSPPDKWVTLADTQGNPIAKQDPATGQILDLPKSPAPRTDTPAETQTAATGAAAQTETARKNAVDEAATAAKNKADEVVASARLALDQSNSNFDHVHQQAQDDLANNRLTLEQYTAKVQEAHDQRMDAQAAVNSAEQHVRDLNDASFQQGQLANQSTQEAESSRHNQATEAETASNNQTNAQISAATLLQNQQKNDQAAADAAATRAQGLLKDRADLATGVNSTLFNAAAGAKNYGLGSQADISGLPAAAQGWATDMMGGQSLFDQAVQQVHAANPAVSGTPQGAAYTSLLEQVMAKKAQVDAGGLTTPGSPPDSSGTQTTAALAPPGVAGAVSPSDPRFLGTVIGAAVQHISGSTPAQRGGLDSFTAPGAGTTV